MATTPNPYQEKEYQQHRAASLGLIPTSAFLSAISRNAGMINGTLTSVAIASIVVGTSTIPLWGIIASIGVALAAAVISAYAGYVDDRLSRPTNLGFMEADTVARARINARETAVALTETLGTELKDIKKESCQTQQAVADLQQKILTWQERESAKEQMTSRVLQ